jgi:hypothetical protein
MRQGVKRREFLRLSALGVVGLVRAGDPFQAAAQTTRKVLIAGVPVSEAHRRDACRRKGVLRECSRRTSGGEAARRRDDRVVTTDAAAITARQISVALAQPYLVAMVGFTHPFFITPCDGRKLR